MKYYKNSRPEMQALFPSQAKTMLEVGCGQGVFSHQLKTKFNVESWGIELMPEEAKLLKKLDKVFAGDVTQNIEHLPDNYFDVIYMNDVLEHIFDPKEILESLQSKLTADGVVISSIPNMRYHSVLKGLVVNRSWEYGRSGVMDFTHLKFYTSKSIKNLYARSGYQVKLHKGINRTRSIKPYLYNLLLLFTFMDIFYVQYATVACRK